jgi:hypothetical protein
MTRRRASAALALLAPRCLGADAPLSPGALDRLNALRDLHEPSPPGLFPPAPGWYLLAALLLGLIVLAVRGLRRRRARSRPIRAALVALDEWARAARAGGDAVAHAESLAALLRRVALVRYPRARVARLGGDDFLAFLDGTLGETLFSEGPGQVLGDARYRGDVQLDVAALTRLTRRWLREHEQGPTHDAPAAGTDGEREATA